VGLTQCELTDKVSTINIVMYPVVVQTAFTNASETVHPAVKDGVPQPASLSPGNWTVKWAIQRAGAGTDGLDRLLAAQAIMGSAEYKETAGSYTGGDLTIRKLRYIISGEEPEESAVTETKKDISYDISAYAGNIGDTGAVNFNVEYVPFNLTGVNDWRIAYSGAQVTTAFNLAGGQVPAWIIRNGLNDLPSDGATNFANFGNVDDDGDLVNPDANANGAIRFVVGVDPGAAPDENLVFSNGVFESVTGTGAVIGFTTGGYTGTAHVYYAAVSAGEPAPGLDRYTYLGGFEAKAHTGQAITLTAENDDVYLIACKDGKASAPYKIGGIYRTYYVKSSGSDSNAGTKENPFGTVQKALEEIAAGYAGSWPGKGDRGQEASAKIVIMGTVDVAARITIDGRIHPPIVLSDDFAASAGKLQGKASINTGITTGHMVYIYSGAWVIMDGGLILAGPGSTTKSFRGVCVNGSATVFTMKGGEISGYVLSDSASAYGGGVYVSEGTFTMEDGKISGNTLFALGSVSASAYGGGVYVRDGTFTMKGGEISGNTLSATTSNSGRANGGGVYVRDGTFIMEDGEISGNRVTANTGSSNPSLAESLGGGVWASKIAKTGGIIYGSTSNTVIVTWKDGDYPYSDCAKGYAVYVCDTHYKNTTVEGSLYYKYPTDSDISGW
jgi:hypothetical protein